MGLKPQSEVAHLQLFELDLADEILNIFSVQWHIGFLRDHKSVDVPIIARKKIMEFSPCRFCTPITKFQDHPLPSADEFIMLADELGGISPQFLGVEDLLFVSRLIHSVVVTRHGNLCPTRSSCVEFPGHRFRTI